MRYRPPMRSGSGRDDEDASSVTGCPWGQTVWHRKDGVVGGLQPADVLGDDLAMRLALLLTACCLTILAAACAEHLPDQDLRILTAQPSAKLSASDLWKDFQADAAEARKSCFGKAIDVSDRPTSIEGNAPGGPQIAFGQTAERSVRARLLDERAADILKDAKVGARLSLRCFCEGSDGHGDVVLKSCIKF